MSPVERLQAAIDKLDALVSAAVERGQLNADDVALAARLIQPAQKILRSDLDSHSRYAAAGRVEEWETAMDGAGDNSLVDAILNQPSKE